MKFFTFLAGFFKESGATESSTRLVGILSFFVAAFLSVWIIVKKGVDASGTDLAVLAMAYSYGCVALGLRKSAETETKTTTIPPASSVEPTVIETTTEKGPA